MTMRKIGYSVLFFAGWVLTTSLDAHAQPKPNIVIFLSDDHGQEDAGCYGNTEVLTPVIDQLAREGMVFTRAYTPVSVCAPSDRKSTRLNSSHVKISYAVF